MVVRDGEEVVRVGVLVIMVMDVVDADAEEVEDRVEEVVVRRVVDVVVDVASGRHCEW